MKSLHRLAPPGTQRGAATLVTAVVLLFALSLITVYAAQIGVIEQRISANDYRSKQAIEQAQAGLEQGITAFDNTWFNGVGSDSGSTNVVNLGAFSVTVQRVVKDDDTLARISTTGSSDDGTASSTVSQLVKRIPLLTGTPPAPLIAAKEISIGSKGKVENKATGIAVWSGAKIDCTGTANIVVEKTGDSVPCKGLGLCGGDDTLASLVNGADDSKFYHNFFSYGPDDMPGAIATTPEMLKDMLNQGKQIIFYQGESGYENLVLDNSIANSIGAANQPVILVVQNGGVTLQGDIEYYGLIYAQKGILVKGTGNQDNSPKVHGALITPENLHTQGEAEIIYTKSFTSYIPSHGPVELGINARLPGSWRDF
ncbi:MAG: hypothetical protein A2V90_03080 [Gammaproteobacteria bacterium RBG_16_57_12]|nr:MAG: hypothetical protein A2V90_03080 [Gammaproteobacteria bacterium RBG_16_57_12]